MKRQAPEKAAGAQRGRRADADTYGLNLERLQRGFPADWTEQRRVLGFKAQQQAG